MRFITLIVSCLAVSLVVAEDASPAASALALCRPNTWERGLVEFTSGERLIADFQVAGGVLTLRAPDRSVPVAQVRHIAFNRVPSAADGEKLMQARRYTEALGSFERALAAEPGQPYVRQQRDEAARLSLIHEAFIAAILAGEARGVLDGLVAYVDASGATRIDPATRTSVEAAWAAIAGTVDDAARDRWRAAAQRVLLRLDWDPRAPQLLVEAQAARAAGKPPAEVLSLFQQAERGCAPFSDDARADYAQTLMDLARLDDARDLLMRCSSEFRQSHGDLLARADPPDSAAPALSPKILASTWIGGAGSQKITSVAFTDQGLIVAKGKGFALIYDGKGNPGPVQGDPAVDDDSPWSPRPSHNHGKARSVEDPRNGQTYTLITRQVHPILMQPELTSSAGWKLYGWSHAEAQKRELMADSRAYDVWFMPDGRIGALFWCDGGNSTLTRDPRNLDRDCGFGGAGGMASYYALINPADGTVEKGLFLRSHVTHRAVDRWGRIYLAKPMDRAKSEEVSGQAGFSVIGEGLSGIVQSGRIGGVVGSTTGTEEFGCIALRGNLLVLGGTTCAKRMKLTNEAQAKAGGDQDGLLAIIRLW